MLRCPECRFKLPDPLVKQLFVTCNNCLTKVNVLTKKVSTVQRTFHHVDHNSKEDVMVEYDEVCTPSKPVNHSTVPCLLCGNPTSELFSTQGSVLVIRTRKETYEEVDLLTGEVLEFDKYIKFPTYKAGFICDDDLMTFTEMCCTRDENRNIKAKLKYVKPKDSKLSDDLIQSLDYSTAQPMNADGTRDNSGDPDDVLIEYDAPVKVISSSMKFKKFDLHTDSTQETAAKKASAARLKPVVQNVNHKFGKPERTRKR